MAMTDDATALITACRQTQATNAATGNKALETLYAAATQCDLLRVQVATLSTQLADLTKQHDQAVKDRDAAVAAMTTMAGHPDVIKAAKKKLQDDAAALKVKATDMEKQAASM